MASRAPRRWSKARSTTSKLLQDHDFHEYKVAVKASDVFLAVAAYHALADAVDCPLHLGITEAGGLIGGTVKSSIGIGNLLWAGIGDTIRVSLSAEPEEEVRVGFEILKALGLRTRGVRVVSCPSCARQGFDVIRTVQTLEERLQHIKTPMSLSVLGCVVNGPGEARETDIGITGGGKGKHMVYPVGRHRPPRPRRGHARSHRQAGRGQGRRDRGGVRNRPDSRRSRVKFSLFSPCWAHCRAVAKLLFILILGGALAGTMEPSEPPLLIDDASQSATASPDADL